MLRLKIISFVLAMLMSMQMLPLAQIGRILSCNQWTEEIPHADDCFTSQPENYHPFLPPIEYSSVVCLSSDSKALAYIHFSEQIPSNHSSDIESPPPDVLYF